MHHHSHNKGDICARVARTNNTHITSLHFFSACASRTFVRFINRERVTQDVRLPLKIIAVMCDDSARLLFDPANGPFRKPSLDAEQELTTLAHRPIIVMISSLERWRLYLLLNSSPGQKDMVCVVIALVLLLDMDNVAPTLTPIHLASVSVSPVPVITVSGGPVAGWSPFFVLSSIRQMLLR